MMARHFTRLTLVASPSRLPRLLRQGKTTTTANSFPLSLHINDSSCFSLGLVLHSSDARSSKTQFQVSFHACGLLHKAAAIAKAGPAPVYWPRIETILKRVSGSLRLHLWATHGHSFTPPPRSLRKSPSVLHLHHLESIGCLSHWNAIDHISMWPSERVHPSLKLKARLLRHLSPAANDRVGFWECPTDILQH